MPLPNQSERTGVTFATYSGWRSYLDGRNRGKKTEPSAHGSTRQGTRDKSNNRHHLRHLSKKCGKNYVDGIVHNTSGKSSTSPYSPEDSDSCGSLASVRSLPVGGTLGAQLMTRNSRDLCMLKSCSDTTDCGYIDATIRPYLHGRVSSGAISLAGIHHTGSSSLTSLARNIISSNTSLDSITTSSCTNMGGGNRNRIPRVFGVGLRNGCNENGAFNHNNNNCLSFINGEIQNRVPQMFFFDPTKSDSSIDVVNNHNSTQRKTYENTSIAENNIYSNSNNNCNIYSSERPKEEENIKNFNNNIYQLAAGVRLQKSEIGRHSDIVDNSTFKCSLEQENGPGVNIWSHKEYFEINLIAIFLNCDQCSFRSNSFQRSQINAPISNEPHFTDSLEQNNIQVLWPHKGTGTPATSKDDVFVYHNSNNNSSRSSFSYTSSGDETSSISSYAVTTDCSYDKNLSSVVTTESVEVENEDGEEDVATSFCGTDLDEYSQTPSSDDSSDESCCTSSSVSESLYQTRNAAETSENISETFDSCCTHRSSKNIPLQNFAVTKPSHNSETLAKIEKDDCSGVDTSKQVNTQSLFEKSGNCLGQKNSVSQKTASSKKEPNVIINPRLRQAGNSARHVVSKNVALGNGKFETNHDPASTRTNNQKDANKTGFLQASATPKTCCNSDKRQASYLKLQINAPTQSCGASTIRASEPNDHLPTVKAANIITPIEAMCYGTPTKECSALTPSKPTEMSTSKRLETCMSPRAPGGLTVKVKRPHSNITLQNKIDSPPPRTRRCNSLSRRKNVSKPDDCAEVRPNKPQSFTNRSATPREQRVLNGYAYLAATVIDSSVKNSTSVKYADMCSQAYPVCAQIDPPCSAVSPSVESPTLYSALCQKRAAEYEANLRQIRLNAMLTSKGNKNLPVDVCHQLKDAVPGPPNSRAVFGAHRFETGKLEGLDKDKDEGQKVRTPSSKHAQTKHKSVSSNEMKTALLENMSEPHKRGSSPHGRPSPHIIGPCLSEGTPAKFSPEQIIASPKVQCWNEGYTQRQDMKDKSMMKQQQSPILEQMKPPKPNLPGDSSELKDKTERWVLKHMKLIENSNRKANNPRRSRSKRAKTRPPIYGRRPHSRGSKRCHSVAGSICSKSLSSNSGIAPCGFVSQSKQTSSRRKPQHTNSQRVPSMTVKETAEYISAPTVEVVYSAPKSIKSHVGTTTRSRTSSTLTTKATLNCLYPSTRKRDMSKRLGQIRSEGCRSGLVSTSRKPQIVSLGYMSKEEEFRKNCKEDSIMDKSCFAIRSLGSANKSAALVGANTGNSHNLNNPKADKVSTQERKEKHKTKEKSSLANMGIDKTHAVGKELKRYKQKEQNMHSGGDSFLEQPKPTDTSYFDKTSCLDDTVKTSCKWDVPESDSYSLSIQSYEICNLRLKREKKTSENQYMPKVIQNIQNCEKSDVLADLSEVEEVSQDSSWPPTRELKFSLGIVAPQISTRDGSIPENNQDLEVCKTSDILTDAPSLLNSSPVLDSSWPPTRVLKVDSEVDASYIWAEDELADTRLKTTTRQRSLNFDIETCNLVNSPINKKAKRISASRSISDLLEEECMETAKHRCSEIRQYIQDKYACLHHKSVPWHRSAPLVGNKRKLGNFWSSQNQEKVDTSILSDEDHITMAVFNNRILFDSSPRTKNESIESFSNTLHSKALNNRVSKDLLFKEERKSWDFKETGIARVNSDVYKVAHVTTFAPPNSLVQNPGKLSDYKINEKTTLPKKCKTVRTQKGPPMLSLSAYDSLIMELKTHYLLERLASLDNEDSVVEIDEDVSGDWDEWNIDDKTFKIHADIGDSARIHDVLDETFKKTDSLKPEKRFTNSKEDLFNGNKLRTLTNNTAECCLGAKITIPTQQQIECAAEVSLVLEKEKKTMGSPELDTHNEPSNERSHGVSAEVKVDTNGKQLPYSTPVDLSVCAPLSESSPKTEVCTKNDKIMDVVIVEVEVDTGGKQLPYSTPVDLSVCAPLSESSPKTEVCNKNDKIMDVATVLGTVLNSRHEISEPVDLSFKASKSQEMLLEELLPEPLDLSTQGKTCSPNEFQGSAQGDFSKQLSSEFCDEVKPGDKVVIDEPLDLSTAKPDESSESVSVDVKEKSLESLNDPRESQVNKDNNENQRVRFDQVDTDLVDTSGGQIVDESLLQIQEPKAQALFSKEIPFSGDMSDDIKLKSAQCIIYQSGRRNGFFENLVCNYAFNPYWHLMSLNMCETMLLNSFIAQCGFESPERIALNMAAEQSKPERQSSVQLVEIDNEPLQCTKTKKKQEPKFPVRHISLLNQRNGYDIETKDSLLSHSLSFFKSNQRRTTSPHCIKPENDLIRVSQSGKGVMFTKSLCPKSSYLTSLFVPAHPNPCTKRESKDRNGDNSEFACVADWPGGCRLRDNTESTVTIQSSSVSSVSFAQLGCNSEFQDNEHCASASEVDSDCSFHSCCSISNSTSA